MENNKVDEWIENFNEEMDSIKISFDAFFMNKPIDSYYNLKVDNEYNNLVLEMIDEDEVPNEIVNRIMDAFEKSKPVI